MIREDLLCLLTTCFYLNGYELESKNDSLYMVKGRKIYVIDVEFLQYLIKLSYSFGEIFSYYEDKFKGNYYK